MIEIQTESTHANKINRNLIRYAVSSTLKKLNKSDVDVTIRLSNNKEIRKLNHFYRGIDEATDVLSFNQDVLDPDTGQFYLGDIIISLDRVLDQASDHGHSPDEECAYLAIHGTLHLLGYDHAEPEERTIMWTLQEALFEMVRQKMEVQPK